MIPWYYIILGMMVGCVLGTYATAIILGRKVNRVLRASRRALGYLNDDAPREAWKVLDTLMNEEDVR